MILTDKAGIIVGCITSIGSVDIEKKENQEFIRQQLGEIVRIVAEKPDLEIKTEMDSATRLDMMRRGQNPDDCWFQRPARVDGGRVVEKEFVHIPESILEGGEVVAMGKAAHEGAHSASTCFDKISAELFPEKTGFMAMLHSLEERPTDQLVRARYKEAGKWLDEARSQAGKAGSDMEGGDKKSLMQIPKFSQLCNLLVYEPHALDLSSYDPEILKKYGEIRTAVEFVENCIPPTGATEEEKMKFQLIRFQVAKNKIWPLIEELVSEDFDQQMLQELLKAILDGEIQFGSGSGEGGGVGIELPPDLSTELDDLLVHAEGKPPEMIIKASEKLIKKLREQLANLTDEQKAKIKEAAQKKLEQEEQKIVNERAAKLVDRPKTLAEKRAEKELAKKSDEEKKQAEEDQKVKEKLAEHSEEVRRNQAAVLEDKSHYDKTYSEIRKLDAELYRALDEILNPTIKPQKKLRSSGNNTNINAAIRWLGERELGLQTEPVVFDRVERPDKKHYAFTFLVDLSRSMSGEKIEQTFKAIVLVTEVMNRLGIDFEVLGFQDELIVFKKFGEQLNKSVRGKISGMEDEVVGSNKGGHNAPNYNDDGPCLKEAAEGLSKRPGYEKFLVVLSDGLPEGKRSGKVDLTRAIENIKKEGKINLVGLGLGGGTEHVKKFYPNSRANIAAKDLKDVFASLIQDMIENPGRYRGRN